MMASLRHSRQTHPGQIDSKQLTGTPIVVVMLWWYTLRSDHQCLAKAPLHGAAGNAQHPESHRGATTRHLRLYRMMNDVIR